MAAQLPTLPELPPILEMPSYEKTPELYIEYVRPLDNYYVTLYIDVSTVHRVVEFERCAQHWSLGAARQRFAGCMKRDSKTRGEFTVLREIEVLVLPQDLQAELTFNKNTNDGIPLIAAGQRIRRFLIEKAYFTNLAVSADPVILLLKGLQFPQP